MTDVDNWDVLDDLISRDEGERKEPDKFGKNETRRPASARRTTTADDWLGLRQTNSSGSIAVAETAAAAAVSSSSYEPSSSRGLNASRRQQNFRRQSTHQRGSRSADLLFGDEDSDGNENNGDRQQPVVNYVSSGGDVKKDLFAADTVHVRQIAPPSVSGDAVSRLPTLADSTTRTKRRETSPTITITTDDDGFGTGVHRTTAIKTTTEKMPSWLSGLIQQKDETLPLPSSPPILSAKETPNVQKLKSEETNNKVTKEKPSTVLSLLEGKENLQSSILELIQDLTKKKQDIQQATITLIQEQQNSDLLIKALLMDNNSSITNSDGQEFERLRSENYKSQLTIDHITKKHELELDSLKTKYELQQNVLHEKLDRFEERINELEEERKADALERKENEKRLKETYEDRLRVIHENHIIDLRQSAEIQKVKMSHLEEVESSVRDSKPKRLTSEEMTAREISIAAQEKKLKDLQEEVDKQLATLEGEKSALQIKIEEFQSRNQRERNELELTSKELKRSMQAFEDGRKAWEREKKSETQYIESRKQELEAVRSSVMEEQRKLSEERYEVASERYRLESMLKLDTGTGTDLIQAKAEVKENFKELKKKEKELEKRQEHVKELEKRLAEEKQKLQERDDEIKIKSIRAEKILKIAISKQEEGLKALESAKDIQSKFDKKGKDVQNRLLDVIRREENIVQEETKLDKEKEAFHKQRKKLDLVLPHLNANEIQLFNSKLNKYEAEKEVYYKKPQLY